MSGKMSFRVGDVVCHKMLDLGRGKVRYLYGDEVLVNFEKASVVQRYPRGALCKNPLHLAGGPCGSCGYAGQSAA